MGTIGRPMTDAPLTSDGKMMMTTGGLTPAPSTGADTTIQPTYGLSFTPVPNPSAFGSSVGAQTASFPGHRRKIVVSHNSNHAAGGNTPQLGIHARKQHSPLKKEVVAIEGLRTHTATPLNDYSMSLVPHGRKSKAPTTASHGATRAAIRGHGARRGLSDAGCSSTAGPGASTAPQQDMSLQIRMFGERHAEQNMSSKLQSTHGDNEISIK